MFLCYHRPVVNTLLVGALSLALLAVVLWGALKHLLRRPIEEVGPAMVFGEAGEASSAGTGIPSDDLRSKVSLSLTKGGEQERAKLAERVGRLEAELSNRVAKGNRELREKNQQLQNLNEELYYLQKRLTSVERLTVAQQTIARLAHKIGTPLNLISGHIQVLQQSRPDDSALHEKLQLVHSQIEKLSGTVRQMLDETRKPVLNLKSLDLNQLLDRILAVVEPALAARDIKVDKDFKSDLDTVEGDEVQLEQVFLSLISNSLDAINQGGKITVASDWVDERVRIRFGDTGEGIPPTVLGQIFRPFFTTKEIGRGTGLGLAIVKEILTAHGAAIDVESVPGLGTTFTIDFPTAMRESKGDAR